MHKGLRNILELVINMTKIIFADVNKEIADAWYTEFKGIANVAVYHGSIFDVPTDALVSPANSFGFMNGGIDGLYTKLIGRHLQERVQEKIKTEFNGELLVGQALVIPTDNKKWPYLITAPTMRLPSVIYDYADVYIATKAALNVTKTIKEIKTISIPGMGTLTGEVPATIAAKLMKKAYEHFLNPPEFPKSLMEIHQILNFDTGET